MTDCYYAEQVRTLLGGRTPREFIELPRHARDKVYSRVMIKENEIVLYGTNDVDNFFGFGMKQSSLLRDAEFIEDSDVGELIATEACEVYYGGNIFQMPSSSLADFINGIGRDKKHVRQLIITLPLENGLPPPEKERSNKHYQYGRDDIRLYGREEDYDRNYWNPRGKQLPVAVRELRLLFQLPVIENIVIQLEGGGVTNGSDLMTQLKLREICRVVKRLMSHFPGKIHVQKSLVVADANHRPCRLAGDNLTEFWHPVSEKERILYSTGQSTFSQYMKIQMEQWMQ